MALFRGKKDAPDQEIYPTETVPTDAVPTERVPVYGTDTPPPVVVRPARSPLMMFLGGLGLIALAGVGILAYSKMNATPTDEGSPAVAPPPISHRVKTATPAAHKVRLPVAGQTTATGTPQTPAKVRTVPVAALGIAPNGSKGPVLAPAKPGGIARMVPVHGAPTPIHPPPGLAAHPGKTGSANTVAIVRPVHPTPSSSAKSAASPQIAAQLKTLWQQGADAKHHKNYKDARRAWQTALKLAPGHPGFQDALNKLPR